MSKEALSIKDALDRASEFGLSFEVYTSIFKDGLSPEEACREWDV